MASYNLRDPIHWLALGFGAGLLKPAPGTWGSLMGALMVAATALLTATQGLLYLLLTLVVCVTGIWICGKTANDIGAHDHGSIVWDEIAGMFVVMAFVPFSWLSLALGFVLFRIFDILKPWPIRWLDRHVKGGLGIMIDDVLAAIMAGVCLMVWVSFTGPYTLQQWPF